MPPTSVNGSTSGSLNVSEATRTHLEEIGHQFNLSDEKLVAITQQFIDDFALGLSEYNKAMAMM